MALMNDKELASQQIVGQFSQHSEMFSQNG
jgi:hypothetical protein